ncbi:hypothetical protein [Nannocystis exedens]|uniref:hypothetical protein n=1 Tax=Nannocystis exedens TaxID=54 RepID=UPI0014755A8A|nr:hypothetical protein [Nannocystis exedens]
MASLGIVVAADDAVVAPRWAPLAGRLEDAARAHSIEQHEALARRPRGEDTSFAATSAMASVPTTLDLREEERRRSARTRRKAASRRAAGRRGRTRTGRLGAAEDGHAYALA